MITRKQAPTATHPPLSLSRRHLAREGGEVSGCWGLFSCDHLIGSSRAHNMIQQDHHIPQEEEDEDEMCNVIADYWQRRRQLTYWRWWLRRRRRQQHTELPLPPLTRNELESTRLLMSCSYTLHLLIQLFIINNSMAIITVIITSPKVTCLVSDLFFLHVFIVLKPQHMQYFMLLLGFHELLGLH